MDQAICVEKRTENSRRAHFNLAGDWRPRLVVWPEYDGLSKDRWMDEHPKGELPDEAWGRIIADAVRDWAKERHLHTVMLRRLVHGALTLPERLLRAVTSNPALWAVAKESWYRIEPDRLNDWQHNRHAHIIFLLTEKVLTDDELGSLSLQPSLDRATLLPYGEAILQFGIEEAVVDICFREPAEEARFIEQLGMSARQHGHRLETAPPPFLSHWVYANRDAFAPGWDQF